MRIILDLPKLSETATCAACIEVMSAMARVGLICERDHGRPAPDLYKAAKAGLVVFAPEPFTDGDHFDLPGFVLQRGWADCDDLVIWRLIECLRHGERDAKPAVVWRKDTRSYHARLRRADGTLEDPTLQIPHLKR